MGNSLAGHGRGLDIGHGAHPPDRAGQSSLDLLERAAAGLRHAGDHEDEAEDADDGEEPEGAVLAQQPVDVLEGLGDDERAGPVETGGDAGGAAADLGRQDLAHHEPGDGPEAQGEADYVDDEARERQPAVLGHRGVHVHVLHEEEAPQGEQRDDHAHAAHVEEHLAAEPVDQSRRDEGRAEVDDADDYGAEVRVDRAAGVLRTRIGELIPPSCQCACRHIRRVYLPRRSGRCRR